MVWQIPAKSVLVPFDFTEPSKVALEAARTMVSRDEDLHALYVAPAPGANSPTAIWGEYDDAGVRRRAKKALDEALAEAFGEVQRHVVIGDAGDEIVGFAADVGFDLIVMPSHGRRGFQRWLLGSVTERVVRLAPCPVLVLRRPSSK